MWRPRASSLSTSSLRRSSGSSACPVMVPAWGPFTAAANMVGVDKLCRWMIRQPEVAHALLSKVVVFAKKVIDHFVDRFRGHPLSAGGGCATSSNQLISPSTVRGVRPAPPQRGLWASVGQGDQACVLSHLW